MRMKHKCVDCKKDIDSLPERWENEGPYDAGILCKPCVKKRRKKLMEARG